MKLQVKDKNGVNNLGKDDIEGKIVEGKVEVNHELFNKAIFGLKGFTSKDGKRTTEVKDVKFDKDEKAYVFDVKVSQDVGTKVPLINKFVGFGVHDSFKLKFKVNDNGQFTAQLKDNWIPDKKILSKL
jgi:hypothetical protein